MAESWKDRIKNAFFGKKPADAEPTVPQEPNVVSQPPPGSPSKASEAKRKVASKGEGVAPPDSNRLPVKSSIVIKAKSRGSRAPASAIDAYVGIDFGTRFTKVALYLPHVEQREILTIVDSKDRLLPSKLAVGADDLLYPPELTPASVKVYIEYLKMRLAEPVGDGFGSLPPGPGFRDAFAVSALSAFYVASVIRLAQKATFQNKNVGIGRPINWTVNVGVPVKHCDSKINASFQEMCGVAWSWKDQDPQPVNIEELVLDYKSTRQSLAGTWSDLPIQVAPELTAALAHFGEDKNTAPGLYAFVDIGGGTLDGSAFRLQRRPDGPEFRIFAAEVDALGTMAVARHAQELMRPSANGVSEAPSTLEQIEQQIVLGGRYLNIVVGGMDRKVQVLLHKVISQTRRRSREHFSDSLYEERPRLRALTTQTHPIIPLFLGGGGARSQWYQSLFERTSENFQQHQIAVGGYSVRILPPPPGIRDDDYPRFVIALGLTSRGLHWDRYKLPSTIEIPPPPPEWQPPFEPPTL